MKVILHVGAHRTGTTSFQSYMRDHADDLLEQGIGFWGPNRTRKSVFPGLFRETTLGRVEKTTDRAFGRVAMHLQQAADHDLTHLLVSDENMLGTARQNLRSCQLYPAVGERMARVHAAFDGRIDRVILSLRSQDHWWASATAMTVGRGHPVPSAQRLEEIAADPRSWRDVIVDLACALPDVDIHVMPFEQHMGRPYDILEQAIDRSAPRDTKNHWLNRAPDLAQLRRLMVEQRGDLDAIPQGQGRMQPFSPEQIVQLRDAYADDMGWLMAGADGLAKLITNPTRREIGNTLRTGALTEGLGHDIGQEQLARPG